MATTPNMEDYLEVIYMKFEEKGYARVTDIADHLDVLPSSVTKMMKKLDERGLGVYEKYRGFVLTSKGKKIAKDIVDKHQTLEDFFRVFEINSDHVYEEVEGIEHHIGKETTFCISTLVRFFEEHPEIKQSYFNYRKKYRP
ncbi:transcriptional regulator MntR [Tenuibacillus multivorans]|uniref:Manganese transport regulator n=1 Tax=Tenuibacillus multivorans TaxID=237069 RepID=A0A1G9WIG4_9BACI|nr:transcriptional regulator MntR [Tenuibacillus multivorans]GEL76482.1 transcriptional regulator MntR [Tenuibacillus multivorans]SDM84382.1 Mn-dependent transcriptional regulator, DtxR family [Tenuibacillus multivorans]